uniref:Plastocyanin-like domain-containing protein n=1 Tax=Timema douglasi TaxID=61478 RepID=A0A7R8VR00_TIMDO|nr:unnamed protein product [Timema douglasi]
MVLVTNCIAAASPLTQIFQHRFIRPLVKPTGRCLGLPQGGSLPVIPDEERPPGRERKTHVWACGNCSLGVMEDCFRPQCITADGVGRGMLSANREFESPTINVCKGDRIVVDMEVMAQGFQECIHWHGLFQEGSQYYDGVPMLTQCAVQFPDSFRYQFCVNQCGTYFYHSHVAVELNTTSALANYATEALLAFR